MRVLFLCTANSARSQFAEALLSRRAGYDAESAGVVATDVNPLTVEALREVGIDWTDRRSKPMTEFVGQSFDLVVTVCDEAREACPAFPGARRTIHWTFDDPAVAHGSHEERLLVFRAVRERIAQRIERAVAEGELAPRPDVSGVTTPEA